MFTLVGLLCLNLSDPSTCKTFVWGEEGMFKTEQFCTDAGLDHLGSVTPFGIVAAFDCRPVEVES